MDDKQLQDLFQQTLSPLPTQESALRSRLMAAIAEEEIKRQEAYFWQAFTNLLVGAGQTVGSLSQIATGWTIMSLGVQQLKTT